MHKITSRKTGFSKTLIAILLLVFVGQAFALSPTECPLTKSPHADHQMMESSMGVDKVTDCCAEEACDMASCALFVLPETFSMSVTRHDGAYLNDIEPPENTVATSLFRPPITH